MTIRDFADEPFQPAEWHGHAAQRKPKQVVVEDESQADKEDPHHV